MSAPARRTDSGARKRSSRLPAACSSFPGFPASWQVDAGTSPSVSRRGLPRAPDALPKSLLWVARLLWRQTMAERGELDLTGAKQNTGVWLVKVMSARLRLALSWSAEGVSAA